MGIEKYAVTIGSRLAEIAARLAGKIAITEGNAGLSYGELDAAAKTIACQIAASAGRRPGFVAWCLPISYADLNVSRETLSLRSTQTD